MDFFSLWNLILFLTTVRIFESVCMQIIEERTAWFSAQSACKDKQQTLACLSEEQDVNEITKELRNINVQSVWLGMLSLTFTKTEIGCTRSLNIERDAVKSCNDTEEYNCYSCCDGFKVYGYKKRSRTCSCFSDTTEINGYRNFDLRCDTSRFGGETLTSIFSIERTSTNCSFLHFMSTNVICINITDQCNDESLVDAYICDRKGINCSSPINRCYNIPVKRSTTTATIQVPDSSKAGLIGGILTLIIVSTAITVICIIHRRKKKSSTNLTVRSNVFDTQLNENKNELAHAVSVYDEIREPDEYKFEIRKNPNSKPDMYEKPSEAHHNYFVLEPQDKDFGRATENDFADADGQDNYFVLTKQDENVKHATENESAYTDAKEGEYDRLRKKNERKRQEQSHVYDHGQTGSLPTRTYDKT